VPLASPLLVELAVLLLPSKVQAALRLRSKQQAQPGREHEQEQGKPFLLLPHEVLTVSKGGRPFRFCSKSVISHSSCSR
jgi:hypothetical protein